MDPKREQAIELLAQGTRKARVARDLSIDRSTLDRWMSEPEFADAISVRTDDILRDFQRHPRRMIAQAFLTLKRAMQKGGPAGVRAALAVLANYSLIRKPDKPITEDSGPKVIEFDFIDDPRTIEVKALDAPKGT